jgi:putative component of toxin-antitoxin plasmid stabilization module
VHTTFDLLRAHGVEVLDVKLIQSAKPLKEIRIHADNEYRIFFTQEGTTVHCWAYGAKGEQEQAIRRAANRMK